MRGQNKYANPRTVEICLVKEKKGRQPRFPGGNFKKFNFFTRNQKNNLEEATDSATVGKLQH